MRRIARRDFERSCPAATDPSRPCWPARFPQMSESRAAAYRRPSAKRHGILLLIAGRLGLAGHFAEVAVGFGVHARARHGTPSARPANGWLIRAQSVQRGSNSGQLPRQEKPRRATTSINL
eukprot:scaffold117627_cov73-Phaeocystis_antarctica.AAC.2